MWWKNKEWIYMSKRWGIPTIANTNGNNATNPIDCMTTVQHGENNKYTEWDTDKKQKQTTKIHYNDN